MDESGDQVDPVVRRIRDAKIVPVVTIDDASRAGDLMSALAAGGVHCAEITLRTAEGLQAIRNSSGIAGMLIGAGTVTSARGVDLAHDAGATFIVSPGMTYSVVERAAALGLPILPGVATASDIQHALELGLRHLKFFPAEPLGGTPMLEALCAPFPSAKFMPTGGVTPQTVPGYLSLAGVFAVGSSWIAPRRHIAEGRFEEIRTLAAAATSLIGSAR